jgi:hypothetical protein
MDTENIPHIANVNRRASDAVAVPKAFNLLAVSQKTQQERCDGSSLSQERSLTVKPKKQKDNNRHHANSKSSVALVQQPSSRIIPTDNTEYWISQQAATLTDWLNEKFVASTVNSAIENDPSTENNEYAANLQFLLEKEQTEKLFLQGRKIFLSNEIQSVLSLVYKEIDSNRLAVRDDRNIHLDVGLQELLYEVLFSYQEEYLQFGLEIIFNKQLHFPKSLNSHPQKLRKVLRVFIQQNLFSFETASTFVKMHFQNQKDFEKIKKTIICTHVMKKFMELVYFLDYVRMGMSCLQQRLLFQKSSSKTSAKPIKTSKELMVRFCQLCLKGEGDILKHLNTLGYKLLFEQKAIDEYDYFIASPDLLFQSFKDGVRFTRLFEILEKNKLSSEQQIPQQPLGIMNQLRFPAGSVLQKKHNLAVVFEAAFGKGHGINIDQIIDGNTNKNKQSILMVLWKFLYSNELEMIIPGSVVSSETERIAQRFSFFVKSFSAATNGKEMISTGNTEQLLLLWCQTIVNQYLIHTPIQNLSIYELMDGKIMNLVMYYYHPSLFPTDFLPTLLCSSTDSNEETAVLSQQQKTKLFLKTFFQACRNLGGIPKIFYQFFSETEFMKSHYNYIHTGSTTNHHNYDDKKTIILFLSYLFLRLVESSKKMKAVIVIQRTYRKFKNYTYLWKLLVKPLVKPVPTERSESVLPETINPEVVVSVVESFDALDLGAFVVESIESIDCFGSLENQISVAEEKDVAILPYEDIRLGYLKIVQEELETSSATVIQRHIRGYWKRQLYNSLYESTLCIQTNYRSYSARKQYVTKRLLVVLLQAMWRRRTIYKSLEKMNVAVFKIMRCFQNYKVHQAYSQQKQQKLKQALQLQLVLKGFREYLKLKEMKVDELKKNAATRLIQKALRDYQIHHNYLVMKESKLQALKKTNASLLIQRVFRNYVIFKLYSLRKQRKVEAIQLIQKVLCDYQVYKRYLQVKTIKFEENCKLQAAECIQKAFRTYEIKRQYLQFKEMKAEEKRKQLAVTLLQKVIRNHQIYRYYLKLKSIKLAEKKQNSFLQALKLKIAWTKVASLWRVYQMKQRLDLLCKQQFLHEMRIAEFVRRRSSKLISQFIVERISEMKEKKLVFRALQKVSKVVKCYLMQKHFKRFLNGWHRFAVRRGFLL